MLAASVNLLMGSGSPTINLTIANSTTDYNIYNQAVSAGYDGTSVYTVNLAINAGVVVGSSSTGTPALRATGFPAGSIINITVGSYAYVVGHGGNGGNGGTSLPTPTGSPGGAGGDALWVGAGVTVNITNGGTVAGGGGGGGGGGGETFQDEGTYYLVTAGGGGGGGGGNVAGSGGSGYWVGKAGTLLTGGSGSGGGTSERGGGGNGGALGAAAQNGWRSSCGVYGGGGGPAGNYQRGTGTINWLTVGTRLGNVSSVAV